MAGIKISQLPEHFDNVTPQDWLPFVDSSLDVTKKISPEKLYEYVGLSEVERGSVRTIWNEEYTPSKMIDMENLITRWENLSTGPSGRNGHSVIEHNGKMYIFGGYDGSNILSDLWEYDISSNTWTELTFTGGPSARYVHSSIEYNGKMYIFGGINGSSWFNDLWEYDINSNTWTELTFTGGPSVRHAHSTIEHNGKMYLFGGYNGSNHFNDLWEYDISSNTWTELTFTGGPSARYAHSATEYNGKMYIFGGNDGTTLGDLWEYDINSNTWTELTFTGGPSGRHAHSTIEYNGKMYIFGGYDGSNRSSDLWEYDISSNTWTELTFTGSPSARYVHSATEYNGKMYIFGGFGGSYLGDFHVLNMLDRKIIYDTEFVNRNVPIGSLQTVSDTEKTPNMISFSDRQVEKLTFTGGPSIRSYIPAIEYNGKMYIFGGYGGSYLGDLWEYDINSNTWTELTFTGGPSARHAHSAIEYNGKMYLFGGYNGSNHFNDLWEYDISSNTWTELTFTGGPSVRYVHSSIEYNGKMYIFGGHDGSYLGDLWEYDISSNTWTELTFTGGPSGRGHMSTIEYNGKMYLFGGLNGTTLGDLWEYDISSNTWTELTFTGGPSARNGHSAIEYNGKMYLFGGHDGSNRSSDLWEYDISSNTWKMIASITPQGRDGVIVIEYNGHFYTFGGRHISGSQIFYNDMYTYKYLGKELVYIPSTTDYITDGYGLLKKYSFNNETVDIDLDLSRFTGDELMISASGSLSGTGLLQFFFNNDSNNVNYSKQSILVRTDGTNTSFISNTKPVLSGTINISQGIDTFYSKVHLDVNQRIVFINRYEERGDGNIYKIDDTVKSKINNKINSLQFTSNGETMLGEIRIYRLG